MKMIDTTDALIKACARLAQHEFVTLDTEFMRETTFYSKLCLIQMASPEEDVLIDPLATGLDLSAFFELMRNDKVLKVLHAGRQDIEIFWHQDQCIPVPAFDTQIAAMVCGYGDSVSYEQLAHDLAKARIDKSSRFTDWAQRPLSDAQLHYARSDVTHLRDVYLALKAKLDESGRAHWLADEMRILTSPSTYDIKPEDAWHRLKGRIRKPRDVGLLMELTIWRELEARERNVPRSRVLKDDILIEVAQAAPRNIDALANLRADQRTRQRCLEPDSALRRIRLVATDDFDRAVGTSQVVRHTTANTDHASRRRGHDFGGGLAGMPIAQLAQHRVAVERRSTCDRSLQFLHLRPDQRQPARRDQIRPGRDRPFELGFQMFLIAFATEGDAHSASSRVCCITRCRTLGCNATIC